MTVLSTTIRGKYASMCSSNRSRSWYHDVLWWNTKFGKIETRAHVFFCTCIFFWFLFVFGQEKQRSHRNKKTITQNQVSKTRMRVRTRVRMRYYSNVAQLSAYQFKSFINEILDGRALGWYTVVLFRQKVFKHQIQYQPCIQTFSMYMCIQEMEKFLLFESMLQP